MFAQDLYPFPLTNASVYVSSTGHDSFPTYVIDEDFYQPEPTCFKWDDSALDVQGFHWLLIDFGVKVRHIAEIRIVLGRITNQADNEGTTIDAYLTPSLSILKHTVMETSNSQSLPWTTFEQSCTSLSIPHRSSTTLTLRCSSSSDSRWLIVRTAAPSLSICLINVYVEHAFKECFLEVTFPERFQGTIYRSIRHIQHVHCREQCAQSNSCVALFYIRSRYSGTCQLIHSFSELDRAGNIEAVSFQCPSKKCSLELNRCERGRLLELHLETAMNVTSNDHSNVAQTWSVPNSNRPDSDITQPEFLASVHFVGNIKCSEWDCGLLYIYSVSASNQEVLCAQINTNDVSVLTNLPVMCNEANIPVPKSIRLTWKQLQPGRMRTEITSGYVRLTNERLESVIDAIEADKEFTPHTSTTLRTTVPIATQTMATTELTRKADPKWTHTIQLLNENHVEQRYLSGESLASINFSTYDDPDSLTPLNNPGEENDQNSKSEFSINDQQETRADKVDGLKMVNDDTGTATRRPTERTHREVLTNEKSVKSMAWTKRSSAASTFTLSWLDLVVCLCISLLQ